MKQAVRIRSVVVLIKGMTFIELLVTMLLAMLLIAVGMPGFVSLRQSQAQAAAMNQTYALLQFARSVAVTDANRVTFCSSTDGATCTNNDNFAVGAVVLSQNPDASQTLIRVVDPITSKNFKLTLQGFASATQLVFTDTGEIENLNSNASLVFCDPRGTKFGDALVINPLGMVRSASDDDGDDIINLHDQSNIVCSS